MSCQRTRRRARGLCAACGEPWKGPQWECDPCRAVHTVKDLARRAEREKARLCRVCNQPSRRGKRCGDCRARELAAYHAQHGRTGPTRVLRCALCGEPGHFAKTCDPLTRAA